MSDERRLLPRASFCMIQAGALAVQRAQQAACILLPPPPTWTHALGEYEIESGGAGVHSVGSQRGIQGAPRCSQQQRAGAVYVGEPLPCGRQRPATEHAGESKSS